MHSILRQGLKHITLSISGSLVENPGLVQLSRKAYATSHGKGRYKKLDRRRNLETMKVQPNAGVRHQMKMMEEEDQQMMEELGQFGEPSELDIYKADQLYDKHTSEEEERREQLKHHIVGKKYFRAEKEPNVLTWAEKEHLRHLHSIDKETHSPETLAESFNIPVEAVKKILKARWLPENETRLKKHDEAVLNNRKQLGLPTPSVLLPLQANTEASEIVVGRNFSDKDRVRQTQSKLISANLSTRTHVADPQNDTMLEGVIQNKKRISYSEFRKSTGLVSSDAASPKTGRDGELRGSTEKSRLEDIAILKYFEDNSEHKRWVESDETVTINIDSPKDSSELAAYFYDSRKGYQHPYGKQEAVPKKINVSAKQKAANGLYRQGDSFYDSDGQFLYRVPHLFSEK